MVKLVEEGVLNIMSKSIVKYIQSEKVKPQTRTETARVDVKIEEPDSSLVTATTLITIYFQYHYYNVPVVQAGISNCIYTDLDTSTSYSTHFEHTLKDYLFDEKDQTYVGCRIFVGVKNLPKKVKYPIEGTLPLVITGQGVEKYAGRIEDAIPVIPDGTFDDNAKELQSDPPPSITGLTLSWGTYLVNKIPVLYIKATWDNVIHNDLQGYDSDIREDGGSYDSPPAPKFNAKNYMIWDADIKPNQKYYVEVRAVDLAGNTSSWVEDSITTGNYTTINAPTNLSAANHPPFSVWLSWTASASDNIFSYEIYRKTGAGGSYAKIGETSSTFYVDQTVTAGTLYYYKIRAVSTSLSYSDYTSEVSITPALLNDTAVQAGVLYDSLASIDSNKLAAGAVTAGKIHAGALLTYNVTVVNRLRKNMVTATISSNTISLTGSVVLVKYNGSSYEEVTISVATSGYITVDTNYWYAYFTPSVDGNGEPLNTSKTITLSTTYPSGLTDVVVGVAQYHYNGTDYKVEWTPYNSVGTIISGDHIVTGSIVADTLRSGTITSTSACIGSLNASKITVGTIQSVNGYNYFNLDNGTFHLGGVGGAALDWNGTSLTISNYATTSALNSVSNTANTALSNAATAQATADSKILPSQVNANVTSISGGVITTGTIYAIDYLTYNYNNEQIKIVANPSFLPQIQFFYAGNLQHYIQESAGTLYIKSSYGGDIHIDAASPYSVYFDSSIHVQNAINISTAVSLSQTTYGGNYYLESDVGILIDGDRGIKFHGIYDGGSLWFDATNNVFKYLTTGGVTKTISAT